MSKVKCGILTINVSSMNYGNRLQNYALQQTLQKRGYEAVTVNYRPTYPAFSYRSLKAAAVKLNRDRFQDAVNSLKRKVLYLRNRKAQQEKHKKYDAFIQNCIKWTKNEYGIHSDLSPLDREFNFMVAGSDQIWNPYWEGTQPIYFMQFVPERKRIAYAASFGVSSIPEEMTKLYQDYLGGIPHISCRESRGCDLVENMTGKRVAQVLDPVFLLEQGEWTEIEEKPTRIKTDKPYILVYFLGEISKANAKKMKQLQKANGCQLIYLDRRDQGNSCFASPTEFLYLVHHASVICTDSFHGSAFALIYHKPFVCFQRSLNNGSDQNMSSRLTSLFDLFRCNRYDSALTVQEMGRMEYSEIDPILQEERERSFAYLFNALQ